MITKKEMYNFINEKETKEATGAASAGGYSAPLFSMFSTDEKAKKEYKTTPKSKRRIEREFKEATSSSSVGSYDTPGFDDVNMRGNNPVGRGKQFKKPLYKGGGFVPFRKKCKTFPYCSEGDSKDKPVKIKKTISPLQEAIENVSLKTGLTVQEIKQIIKNKLIGNL